MKLFIILASLFIATFADQLCDCGKDKAFNAKTYKCDSFPKKGKTGYVDNCRTYILTGAESDKYECKVCDSQYKLSANKCIKTDLDGCLSFENKPANAGNNTAPSNTTTSALLQINQRFLASNDTSVDTTQQCIKCDSEKYYLKDHKCVANPKSSKDAGYDKKCITYAFKNNNVTCTDCKEGYYVSDNKCAKNPSTPKHCETFKASGNNSTKCVLCKDGYAQGNTKECKKHGEAIKNCEKAVYLNSYKCAQCKKGYFIDSAGSKCTENPKKGKNDTYVADCQQYQYVNNKLVCYQCKDNQAVTANSTTCAKLTLDKKDKVDNCWRYSQSGTNQFCGLCDTDYFDPKLLHNSIKDSDPTIKKESCKKCPVSANILQIGSLAIVLVLALIL